MERKKHILIIDDEPEISEILKTFLEESGFTTEVAIDGIQGLLCIKDRLPDLVVTDLLLPGEHGIDVIKTIKKKYFVPVIIITGVYEHKELKGVMDEFYVEGFFQKPLQLDELLEKIRSILHARAV